MSKRRANVLLVEDSQSDQVIVKRVLEDGCINCNLHIANNGAIALQMLRNEAPYDDKSDYCRPDLVLMDINMPVLDGKATLQAIRADEELKHIPVIMLTTSDRDKDVIESYKLGVNAYLTKPVEELAFINVVQQIEQFWFELVTLPR